MIFRADDEALKTTYGMQSQQMPGEQCSPDAGTVPEGLYKVFIVDHGVAKDDGFYLHDSVKGFSHGCIKAETKLFKHRDYHSSTKKKSTILKVNYVAGRTTNGGIKI